MLGGVRVGGAQAECRGPGRARAGGARWPAFVLPGARALPCACGPAGGARWPASCGDRRWVARIWRKWGLQPWRRESFKFSTDPQLEAKVGDVVGLYLNPPEKAVVLCSG